MRRPVIISLSIVVLICCASGIGYFAIIRLANNSLTHLSVSVVGSVDEVAFYKQNDPEHVVATIRTNGKDTTQTIDLPNADQTTLLWQAPPVKYFYVTRSGESSYQSPVICCATRIGNQSRALKINALNQYEVFDN